MNTLYSKLKKLKGEVARLESQLEQEKKYEYGRMALESDEANFSVNTYGEIDNIGYFGDFHESRMHGGRTFTTVAAANRYMKAERLAFKCKQAMAESWGKEKAYWTNSTQIKHCLSLYKRNEIKIYVASVIYQQFAFKTMEDAQGFIDSHNKDDIILMLMRGDV